MIHLYVHVSVARATAANGGVGGVVGYVVNASRVQSLCEVLSATRIPT